MRSLWKHNVSFVLVDPKEAGNIGASARAIKNMGFKSLELVRPAKFPSLQATVLSHGAEDVLESAPVHKELKDAIADKSLIVGTSRRAGRKRGLMFPLKEGVKKIASAARKNKVAVLFGTEDKGLSNKEVDECGFLISIPADPSTPSINLAQAVLLVSYELSGLSLKKTAPLSVEKEELDFLCERVNAALRILGYHGDTEVSLMRALKHLIGRAGLTAWEIKLLHGICTQVEKRHDRD